MPADLTNPIFQNEEAARDHFEAIHWPNGPVCPHCGNVDRTPRKWDDPEPKTHIAKMKGKSHRAGLYWCFACDDTFTVTVGTVMERSHIPLHKWALAIHLMSASKKGISAHQLHRMLGISYKAAWFMCHRIREGMRDDSPEPLGGTGKTLEADETFIGPRKWEFSAGRWKAERGTGSKRKVLTLVERGGRARSVKLDNLRAPDIGRMLDKNASKDSILMTDEAKYYMELGLDFEKHGHVVHMYEEYVKKSKRKAANDSSVHTNTVEGFFSIFKRGMKGIYQHCGEQHLQRYLHEFDFRYSNRIALGVDDKERARRATKQMRDKRLTYKETK